MQMRIIRVGGKCHFWHFIPTPLSLDCIEPQPLGQSCTTLPTTLLWWAIKVDCQDTAWPSLLPHAKRERNWLPTRSHSRQLHGLSSTAWAGTAKTPSKAHGFYTMSWTELQYRWEHWVGGQCQCLTLLYWHQMFLWIWHESWCCKGFPLVRRKRQNRRETKLALCFICVNIICLTQGGFIPFMAFI